MKVLKSYYEGIRKAALQQKMICVLWLINIIFGFVIFYLSYEAICDAIGKSALADNLLKKFDFNVLFEFLVHDGKTAHVIFSVALVLILVYFLVSIFLYGGILFSLAHPQKLNTEKSGKGSFAPVFFQGAGRFFGRFFRLSIYSLIFWGVFILFNVLLNRVGRILTDDGTNEQVAFYLFWVRLGIGLFLLYLIRMIMDYTRIKIVIEDSRYVFRSLFQMTGFVFQKLGKTLALYYLILATGIILFVIYWGLKSIIPSHNLLTVIFSFVVAQLFIASRGWVKIAFCAAQLCFYSPQSHRGKDQKI